MANLKDLKNRINSVKSTRKITSAMKMAGPRRQGQSVRTDAAARHRVRANPSADRRHR
jgi:F-type H+-transporting ATPase subunit gamma